MKSTLAMQRVVGRHDGPHLLITGGVHGDEFEPMAAVRRLMHELQPERLKGRVTLVPCVNEPAFRLGRRTAEDGLDLARTCPGNSSGSVTERIAYQISELIRAADYYIDLHTGGTGLQVYPLAGYSLHPRLEILDIQRRMARAFGLPLIWGTDPNLQGRTLSVARDAAVPAIYTEYLGGGGCDPRGIAAYVRGCTNVLAELGMLFTRDEALPESHPEPLIVEDPRPNSGHMQLNHPAPVEGFLQPAVQLGQRVRQGDCFGTVTDVLGQQNAVVTAAQTGCVIVLRTFSRVAAGDTLGVVLETDAMLPRF